MVWSMLRPDLFGGFATHAGDALFEVTLGAELAPAAQALRNLYGGSFEAFWADFRSGRRVFENHTDPLLQNVYATAAAFSAAPDGTVELPFSLETGIVLPDVFARWLAWDPVRMAPEHAQALAGLRAIWIDAGRGDEYRLDHHPGPLIRVSGRRRRRRGLPPMRCISRLFDGGHREAGETTRRKPAASSQTPCRPLG